MPRIDFLKKNLGQVDLGRGRRSTMGNIDKDGRYWHGEIEISVEIISYYSWQRDYTPVAAMSAGKQLSLKSSLNLKWRKK